QAAIEWIIDNPAQFLRLSFKKFLRTWSPLPNYEQAQSLPHQLALFCSYVPVMLLAFYGLWRTRRHWRYAWLPLVPVITIALLHMVVMGSIRYRLPAMACIIIFSGKGLSSLTRRWIDGANDRASYLK
ncbi:MAG: hypothetical protein JXA52_03805, partial [Planctomycetes bacterium]|nr:hypothetical protein [Planctomycetota bacterium]